MQTPLTTFVQTAPGGDGLIVGEKESLGPPTAFSVGEGVADVGAGADVVADVEDGASFSVDVLHAVTVPMATRAIPPAANATLRVRPEIMCVPFVEKLAPSCHAGADQGALKPSRLCAPSQNGLFSECPQRHR